MRTWLVFSVMCLLMGCPSSRRYACGDLVCQGWKGETAENCPGDCTPFMCGDGTCGPSGQETCEWCRLDCDCRPECGDGVCASTESCAACPSDCQTSCESTCGPANCAGCCAGNTCLTGALLDSCGSGGGICQTCGTDMVCDGTLCVIDPASTWNLYVHSFAIEPPYDDDGPPDLVLEISSPVTHERIAFMEATPDATSAEFTPPVLAGANIPLPKHSHSDPAATSPSHERSGRPLARGARPRPRRRGNVVWLRFLRRHGHARECPRGRFQHAFGIHRPMASRARRPLARHRHRMHPTRSASHRHRPSDPPNPNCHDRQPASDQPNLFCLP